MANTYTKIPLSGSTDGRPIKVGATATPGTTIHTAQASTTLVDEMWIWAYNSDASAKTLTIEIGGVTTPYDLVVMSIPGQSGLVAVLPGFILRNSLILRAFCNTTNVVILHGYIHRES